MRNTLTVAIVLGSGSRCVVTAAIMFCFSNILMRLLKFRDNTRGLFSGQAVWISLAACWNRCYSSLHSTHRHVHSFTATAAAAAESQTGCFTAFTTSLKWPRSGQSSEKTCMKTRLRGIRHKKATGFICFHFSIRYYVRSKLVHVLV